MSEDQHYLNFKTRNCKYMDSKLVYTIVSFLHLSLILSNGEIAKRTLTFQEIEKPANTNQNVIKSIKTENGDIFDCINIMSQPTFQDRRFMNHTIQIMPSSFPVLTNADFPSKEINLTSEIKTVSCPSGTIPIWKNHKVNLTDIQTIFPKGRKNGQKFHMAAIGVLKTVFGTTAEITVHKPDVVVGPELRVSGASAYLRNDAYKAKDQEYMEAGWFVWPKISGDNDVRFHIFWQDSNQRKECVNLLCTGFVQTSPEIALGSALRPVSQYGGAQYSIILHMFKDFQTGNWWLAYGGDKKPIGYWAKETFNHMDKGAGRVSWGGMVVSPSNEKTPAMGSGHFPSEGFRQSAYVSYPRYVDGDNNLQKPDEDWTYRLVDNADCYDADKLSPKVVNGFFYGGPAGCKD